MHGVARQYNQEVGQKGHNVFELVLQRDFFAGWAKAVALPTEKCGFTTTVGKIDPLPTVRRNSIRLHFSL